MFAFGALAGCGYLVAPGDTLPQFRPLGVKRLLLALLWLQPGQFARRIFGRRQLLVRVIQFAAGALLHAGSLGPLLAQLRPLLITRARLRQTLFAGEVVVVVATALGADAYRLGGLMKLALRLLAPPFRRVQFRLGKRCRVFQPRRLLLALQQRLTLGLQCI